ncbi:Connector enhancer of kinase suppressor of ras [Bienertia sinuspersici]
MLSSSSYCISHRPLTLPSLSKLRVPNRPASFSLLNRSFRVTDSHFSSSKSRWKICCFRQEEFSAENLKPEGAEDILGEELVKPKLEIQKIVDKDWRSSLGEAAVSVFRAIGDRGLYHGQGKPYCKLCYYGLLHFGLWVRG